MKLFLENAAYFGVFISLASYYIGTLLRKKINFALFNPLLVSIVSIIVFLKVFNINHVAYLRSNEIFTYLLTPATICLAIPLYEQFELLKHNYKAVLLGIASGIVASLGSVLVLCILFKMGHENFVTLLPKSLTNAIGMEVSRELGGYPSATVSAIIITGVFGNIVAEAACRWFRFKSPIAKGVAIGSAAHAMGTSKALEMGQVEGAMGSLSIVVSGLLTVIAAGFVANVY